jgi:predicted alpha/beta-hydrolase family hydrolase
MTRAGRRRGPAGVVLFPGAGTAADHPSLVAVADAVAPCPIRRVDFPYRRAGRRAPDRAPVLVGCVRDEVTAFAAELGVGTDRLVIGGRSMGGRMCSMAVAEGLPVAALVLICYPLHPPGRPDRLRVEHLPLLGVPCLFVHGTRDPFATPEELSAWTATIPGPVTHVWVDGARHDLAGADATVAAAVASWCATLTG